MLSLPKSQSDDNDLFLLDQVLSPLVYSPLVYKLMWMGLYSVEAPSKQT